MTSLHRSIATRITNPVSQLTFTCPPYAPASTPPPSRERVSPTVASTNNAVAATVAPLSHLACDRQAPCNVDHGLRELHRRRSETHIAHLAECTYHQLTSSAGVFPAPMILVVSKMSSPPCRMRIRRACGETGVGWEFRIVCVCVCETTSNIRIGDRWRVVV